MKISAIPLLFLLSVLNICNAEDNPTSNNKPIYSVKAEVKEIRNRTLECKVRNHTVLIDQPESFGADDKAPTPPEMLAISLGGCVASTMQFVAAQRKIEVKDIRVVVEGDIDYTTALGMCCSDRSGFSGFKIKISFDSKLTDKEKTEFIDNVFKIGAVIDNIINTTPVKYEITK